MNPIKEAAIAIADAEKAHPGLSIRLDVGARLVHVVGRRDEREIVRTVAWADIEAQKISALAWPAVDHTVSGADAIDLAALAAALAAGIRARDPLAAEAIEGEGEDAAVVKRRIVDILRRQADDDAAQFAGVARHLMEARRAHLAADEIAEQALGLLRVIARGTPVDNLAAVVAALDAQRVAAFARMTRETTP